MRLALSGAACALLFFLLPLGASAQERVLVLNLRPSQTTTAEAAARLTEALRLEISLVPGWTALPIQTDYDQAFQEHACRIGYRDGECFARIAAATDVGHVVFGNVRSSQMDDPSSPLVVELGHYNVQTARFDGSAYRTVPVDEEAAFTARIQTLLEDIRITPRATQVQQPAAQQGDDRTLLLGLGIGSYVVAAGWIIGAIATIVRVDDIEQDPAYALYRGRVPPGTQDVCAEAAAGNGWTPDEAAVQGLCTEAGTLEVLHVAFWIAGAAFAGLGTAFLLVEPGSEQQPAVTVTPTVGADRAGLSLAGRF